MTYNSAKIIDSIRTPLVGKTPYHDTSNGDFANNTKHLEVPSPPIRN